MSNVTEVKPPLNPIQQARKEVVEEITRKAVTALKVKLRDRDAAARVLANIDREIADLEKSINDGSFVA
jgi:hypothetical protein